MARALLVHHQLQATDVIQAPAAERKELVLISLTSFFSGEKLSHEQVRVSYVIVFGAAK